MKPVKKIVIVGGGTAGWIAASALAHDFRSDVLEIELVESDDIGIIGVGESTVPPFVELINNLGIDAADFMQKTHATFKLAIKFPDWRNVGETFYHPFGWIGTRLGPYDFYQVWLKAKSMGYAGELQDFAPCTVMSKENRFALPHEAPPRTPLGSAGYAFHIDANLVAKYLRGYAEERKVTRTEGKVTEVRQDENGNISSLLLENGKEIDGDFFVDCTGFYALMIEKTLGVRYEDWLNYLPCNRAVAVQTEDHDDPVPYTQATAREEGWSWRIPLQGRSGDGYVFCDEYISDDEATAKLLSYIDGKPIVDPWVIPFKAGVRESFWHKNCVSIGLASGFIEPLEATAIHIIVRGVDYLLRNFPDQDFKQAQINEYNHQMRLEYEVIRDFVVMHYCLTEREDTPFWKHCKHMDIPLELKERIELFKAHGALRETRDELFKAASWQSILEGMGVRPDSHRPQLDNLEYPFLEQKLNEMQAAIAAMVQGLPTHGDLLRDRFRAG